MKLSHLVKVLNEYKKSFDESNFDPDVVVRTDDFEERDLFDDFCISMSNMKDKRNFRRTCRYFCLFTYDENAKKEDCEKIEIPQEEILEEPSEELEKEQMTKEEFNEKYKDYIEEGYPGMELTNKTLIWYIDKAFEDIVKIPNFKLKKITYEFGSYYVNSNLNGLDDMLEDGIQNAYNTIKQIYGEENNEENIEN